MSGCGAKIVHNHITQNNFSDTTFQSNLQLAFGGGFFVSGDDNVNDWLILEHNIIDQNVLHSQNLQVGGAGFWIDNTNAMITDNIISENVCTATMNSSSIAAAFGVHSANEEHIIIKVLTNIFRDNSCFAENSWAACAVADCENAKVIFSGNTVEHNDSHSIVTSGSSGALTLNDPDSGSIVRDNLFHANISSGFGGAIRLIPWHQSSGFQTVIVENNYFLGNEAGQGGAIYDKNIPLLLQNNVFGKNHASGHSGAAYFMSGAFNPAGHLATLINNTFSENKAGGLGGAIYSSGALPVIINSIFWNDSSYYENCEICVSYLDTAEIAFSDIDPAKIKGYWIDGDGNINGEDPMFVDPDLLTIDQFSPCWNTGTNQFTCACGITNFAPEYDLFGSGRPQSGAFEMGAYEALINGVPDKGKQLFEFEIYPNPAIDKATICYDLENSAHVTLTLFNSFGQAVATPVNAWQGEGEHRLTVNTESLTPGMYFCRIETRSQVHSDKLMVVK